jgi:L-alanine-DL-glutamate epimerase-like enolase superfamily enzyme
MKISRLRVYQVDLPLDKPYALSGGRLHYSALDSTIVEIETDEGLTGIGESCPWGRRIYRHSRTGCVPAWPNWRRICWAATHCM